MDHEFTYDVLAHREEGYIHIIAKGTINLEMLKQMYASVLKNPKYERGMSRLWDFTHLDVSLLAPENLRSFAEFMKQENLGTDTAQSAIIVSRDLEFGMVRMLQGLGHGVLSPNVLVTKNHDEALIWIAKPKTDR